MICVRIPKETLRGFGSDIHAMLHTLEVLRKAGVPVVGLLGVMGAQHGELQMFDDSQDDEVSWTWLPADPDLVEDLS